MPHDNRIAGKACCTGIQTYLIVRSVALRVASVPIDESHTRSGAIFPDHRTCAVCGLAGAVLDHDLRVSRARRIINSAARSAQSAAGNLAEVVVARLRGDWPSAAKNRADRPTTATAALERPGICRRAAKQVLTWRRIRRKVLLAHGTARRLARPESGLRRQSVSAATEIHRACDSGDSAGAQ